MASADQVPYEWKAALSVQRDATASPRRIGQLGSFHHADDMNVISNALTY
jgi:hypothetical protein